LRTLPLSGGSAVHAPKERKNEKTEATPAHRPDAKKKHEPSGEDAYCYWRKKKKLKDSSVSSQRRTRRRKRARTIKRTKREPAKQSVEAFDSLEPAKTKPSNKNRLDLQKVGTESKRIPLSWH